jgi:hypothetical protein
VLAFLAVVVAGVHRLQSTSAWRRGSAQPPGAASAHGRYGRLHAALGLLVMGATGVGMAHDAGAAGMHQHLGVVAVTWQVVLGGLTLGYLVLTVNVLRDGVRRRSRALPLVETLAMGVAVAVMSAAMV